MACKECKRKSSIKGYCKKCFTIAIEKRANKALKKALQKKSIAYICDSLTGHFIKSFASKRKLKIELRFMNVEEERKKTKTAAGKKRNTGLTENAILFYPETKDSLSESFCTAFFKSSFLDSEFFKKRSEKNTTSLLWQFSEDELKRYAKYKGIGFSKSLETEKKSLFLQAVSEKYPELKGSLSKSALGLINTIKPKEY